jgi:hypothetical protein
MRHHLRLTPCPRCGRIYHGVTDDAYEEPNPIERWNRLEASWKGNWPYWALFLLASGFLGIAYIYRNSDSPDPLSDAHILRYWTSLIFGGGTILWILIRWLYYRIFPNEKGET